MNSINKKQGRERLRIDVSTGDSLVLVGENKVGKINFLRALQLILDPIAGANLQKLIDTAQATLSADAEVVAVADRITSPPTLAVVRVRPPSAPTKIIANPLIGTSSICHVQLADRDCG